MVEEEEDIEVQTIKEKLSQGERKSAIVMNPIVLNLVQNEVQESEREVQTKQPKGRSHCISKHANRKPKLAFAANHYFTA